MAIEKNHIRAIHSLGFLYEIQHKYDLAEKYYLMAAERNIPYSTNKLGDLYKKQGKHELAEKYYLMALEKGSFFAFYNLRQFYGNDLKLYHVLTKIPNKVPLINKEINKLKKKKDIICFENKKNILSKKDQCPICLEDTDVIPKECTHSYCYNCFVEIDKCAVCRFYSGDYFK